MIIQETNQATSFLVLHLEAQSETKDIKMNAIERLTLGARKK